MPIDWQDPDFYDPAKIEAEMRRVFEICHGCRRCFNLCDSFPRLFDLIDSTPTGEIEAVDHKDYAKVAEACTLCDMCFMTKCPYVPPHAFNVDFPHLMLRHRAAEAKAGKIDVDARASWSRPTATAALAGKVAPLANWATRPRQRPDPAGDGGARRHRPRRRAAEIPRPHLHDARRGRRSPAANVDGARLRPQGGALRDLLRQLQQPPHRQAARAVLAHNGVACEAVYPGCCGMPQLEQGDLARVAARARQTAGGALAAASRPATTWSRWCRPAP